MTEPIPVRVTELQEVVEGGRTVRSARIVEYAAHEPPGSPTRAALPSAEPPRCTCALCESGMTRTQSGPARQALPPAPPVPARPWWRWRR